MSFELPPLPELPSIPGSFADVLQDTFSKMNHRTSMMVLDLPGGGHGIVQKLGMIDGGGGMLGFMLRDARGSEFSAFLHYTQVCVRIIRKYEAEEEEGSTVTRYAD